MPFLFSVLLFCIPFSKGAVEVLFVLLLAAWCSEKLLRPAHSLRPLFPLRQRIVFYALAFYTLLCAASIAWSDFPFLSGKAWLRKTAEYTLLFLIAADLSSRPGVVERNVRTIMTASWLLLAHGILQELLLHNPWAGNGIPSDPFTGKQLNYLRMIGPYENPNDLATFLMVSALLFWANRSSRLLAFLLTLCLVWTKSMGGLIGFSIGILFLGLQGTRSRRRLFLALAGVAAVFAGFLALEPHIQEVFTFSDLASRERLTMWQTGWRMAWDRPWFGHGLNTFMANYQRYALDPHQAPAYAHNCFLQVFAETGWVGLTAFLGFLFALFSTWASVSRQRSSAILSGLAAGVAAFLVQSAVDTNLYALRQAVLFWSFAGMGLGLSGLLQTDASAAPRKVVRVMTRLNIGGPAQQAVALSEGMAAFGWSTLLVTGEPDPHEGDMSYLLDGKGVRYLRLPDLRRKPSFFRDLRASCQLLRCLVHEQPQVLHTHTAKAGALGRLAGYGYRLLTGRRLLIFHTFHGHVLEGYFNPWKNGLIRTTEWVLAKMSTRLITVSESLQRELAERRLAPACKIRVIPLGLPLEPLLALESPPPVSPVRIGIVGRLVPIKNHTMLFEAARILLQRNKELPMRFLLYGDGELRSQLTSLADQMGLLPIVEFRGWEKDRTAIYRTLQIVCLTSRNEGTPVSLIEAMAAARPIVATCVGGVRDLIGTEVREGQSNENGFRLCERGISVAPDDAAGLASALERLATDRPMALQLGQAGRRFAADRFTLDRLTRDIHRLYLESA